MKPIATHWTFALCPLVLVLLSSCMTAPEEKLRLAAAEGNLLQVQTFLGQGISAQAADVRGVTPLFLAAKKWTSGRGGALTGTRRSPSHHFPEFRIDGASWTQMAFHQHDRPNCHRP